LNFVKRKEKSRLEVGLLLYIFSRFKESKARLVVGSTRMASNAALVESLVAALKVVEVVLVGHSVEVVGVAEVILLLLLVVLTEGLADVELALLEDEVLAALVQHLHRIALVVISDEAVALRVAHSVHDDAGILDASKVGKVVSQLVLRCRLGNSSYIDTVADGMLLLVHTLIAMRLLVLLLRQLLLLVVHCILCSFIY